jgi:membrane protease YdiL (CAAX protease family)
MGTLIMERLIGWLWRIARALLEYGCIELFFLFVLWKVFAADWRALIDDSSVAFGLPFLLAFAICALPMWWLRKRYSLKTAMPIPTPSSAAICRWYVAFALLAPWAAFLLSVDQWSIDSFVELVSWRSLGASLSATVVGATMEELTYRFVLMGLLIRAGIPAVPTLVLQTLLFVLAHHKAPFTGPHALFWYVAISATLGAVYLAARSLIASILLHVSTNVLLAQVWPQRYWIAPRPVEGLHMDWTRTCAELFCLLGAALLAALAWERWRNRRRPMPFALPGHPGGG